MTASEIQSIVFTGGSVILSAMDFTAATLQHFAFIAKSHGAKITIRHASQLTASQCKSIAFSGGGQGVVTFDFCE